MTAATPLPKPAAALQPKIYAALAAVQAEVLPVSKGRKNEQQGYPFRGIEDVVAMIHPLLAKHGVLMLPTVVEQQRHEYTTANAKVMNVAVLTVRFDFVAEDGSSLAIVTVGEGADSMDKATNKAMTAAQKYALTLAFSIPFGDQADGDGKAPGERSSPQRRQAPRQSGGGKGTITEKQWKRTSALIYNAAERLEIDPRDAEQMTQLWRFRARYLEDLGIAEARDLPVAQYEALCERIEALTREDLALPETPPESF